MTTLAKPGSPRRPARVHGTDGFSLLEILFALTFLGVGLLAVAGMIPLATHQIVSAKRVTDAVSAGQTRMEALRTASYNSAALVSGSYDEDSGTYHLAWTIQDNVPVEGSKRIDMTVSWTTSSGLQTTRLTTFVTR